MSSVRWKLMGRTPFLLRPSSDAKPAATYAGQCADRSMTVFMVTVKSLRHSFSAQRNTPRRACGVGFADRTAMRGKPGHPATGRPSRYLAGRFVVAEVRMSENGVHGHRPSDGQNTSIMWIVVSTPIIGNKILISAAILRYCCIIPSQPKGRFAIVTTRGAGSGGRVRGARRTPFAAAQAVHSLA